MAENPQTEWRRTAEIPEVPEYKLPPGAFTGEEMFAHIRTSLAEFCDIYALPATVIDQVIDDAREWASVQPGEPLLRLGRSLDRTVIDLGGTIRSPLYGVFAYDNGHPRFMFDVELLNHRDQPETRAMALAPEDLMRSYAGSKHFVEVMVGEQAIRERLADIGRGMQGEQSEVGNVRNIAVFFTSAQRALLTPEHFGFDYDDRAAVCTRLLEAMLTNDDSFSQAEHLAAVKYLAGVTTPEQFEVLLDSIVEQIASVLPVSDDDPDTNPIAALEKLSQHHKVRSDLLEVAGGVKLTKQILHTSMVADLYERRAEQEHVRVRELPEIPLVIPQALVSETIEPRDPMILRTATLRPTDIRQDISYLRALAENDQPVTTRVKRDFARMRLAVDSLSRYVGGVSDPVTRAEVFLTMEYLFDLQRTEQQDEFYRLMGERFALSVPLEGNQSVQLHIRVADTMSQLMPIPLRAPDGIRYAGEARIAAMMAHFYRRRSYQLLAKQLRKYEPVEEGDD